MAKVFYDPMACALIDQSILSDKHNAAGGPLMREAAERIEGFTTQTWFDSTIVEGAEYSIFYPRLGKCVRVCVQDVFTPERVMISLIDHDFDDSHGQIWARSLFLGMRAAAAVIEANK